MNQKPQTRFRRIILASASPRRLSILRKAGFQVTAFPTNSSESFSENLTLNANLKAISEKKLRAALKQLSHHNLKEKLIISADTMVVVGGRALGKPKSPAHARQMLTLLSGRSHRVMTAFSVCNPSERRGKLFKVHTKVVTTTVVFRRLSTLDIEAYVDTGEPLDKAGGYAIQGRARKFVKRIKGEFQNVVGLPIREFRKQISRRGWRVANVGSSKRHSAHTKRRGKS